MELPKIEKIILRRKEAGELEVSDTGNGGTINSILNCTKFIHFIQFQNLNNNQDLYA